MQTQLNYPHDDTQPILSVQPRARPRYKQSEFWNELLYKLVVLCIIFIFVSYVQMATASINI